MSHCSNFPQRPRPFGRALCIFNARNRVCIKCQRIYLTFQTMSAFTATSSSFQVSELELLVLSLYCRYVFFLKEVMCLNNGSTGSFKPWGCIYFGLWLHSSLAWNNYGRGVPLRSFWTKMVNWLRASTAGRKIHDNSCLLACIQVITEKHFSSLYVVI